MHATLPIRSGRGADWLHFPSRESVPAVSLLQLRCCGGTCDGSGFPGGLWGGGEGGTRKHHRTEHSTLGQVSAEVARHWRFGEETPKSGLDTGGCGWGSRARVQRKGGSYPGVDEGEVSTATAGGWWED